MSATWFISDTHFGHNNIIRFKRDNGEPLRNFSSIEEHDELIVKNWNEVIKPADRVYHMGDVAINKKNLAILDRLNGRKKLIKGNHDIFKLKDYTPYFEDILSYRIYPEHGLIVSHIPIYAGQMDTKARWNWNAHGHTHANMVTKSTLEWSNEGCNQFYTLDSRYINLCLEHTDYKPVSFDELLIRIGYENKQYRSKNANSNK